MWGDVSGGCGMRVEDVEGGGWGGVGCGGCGWRMDVGWVEDVEDVG